jgi:hypothetical protein
MAIDCTVICSYRRGHMDQTVFKTLVIAFSVVQVDTLIPISLNREKYGTHGILGTASGYASMRDL